MAYQIIDLEQRSQEWLDFRKKHIGASEAPIIMKESPWKTPRQLMHEKWGLVTSSYKNKSMQRGIDLEERAREQYIKTTGIEVKPLVVKSVDHPFMIASYDGVSNDYKKAVEIKCPGDQDHNIAKKGEIPRKYIYQLIQQMIVLELDSIDYFSYKDDQDVGVVHLSFSDVKKEAKRLIREEGRFWECWQNLEEPDLVSNDYEEKSDREWEKAVQEYLQAKAKLKESEESESMARSRIVELCKGKNCEGSGIRVSRYIKRGFVDYASIPEISEINLEKYRKPSIESWKIAQV